MKILYEDNHVIVVIKKPNLLVQSDITEDDDLLSIVKKYLKEKYNKPGNVYVGLVHRLDRSVGGIIVLAKTSKAASRLSNQVSNNKFVKKYMCLVHGKIKKSGTLENKLLKDESINKSFVNDNGKLSILNYELIKYIDDNSLVEVELITGRHHQIRVQLSNINHPVIGDIKYGSLKKTLIKLYAYKLGFYHPISNDYMEFIDYPDWM